MALRRTPWLVSFAVAVTSWGIAVSVAQTVLGADIGRAAEEVEQRIELHLRGLRAPPPPPPERSREQESIEPWELVSV